MPLDAYSLCPGGTSKKIKFCCPDFLPELDKIDRMLEGAQHVACLQHINTLLREHPDKACLLATKLMLARATNNLDDARATAEQFLQKHPENTIALAESAMVRAADEGGPAGLKMLHRALAASDGGIQTRVYEAMGIVAESLLREGRWLAGRSLLQLQMAVANDDQTPMATLMEMNRTPGVPLLMKGPLPIAPVPDDALWKSQFEPARELIQKGCWQEAEEKLAALTNEFSDVKEIWQSLAAVRSWLADHDGCSEALRKYAALDVPLEDAVEAEALALMLSEDPLGDRVEMLSAVWEVKDFEKLQGAMSLDPQASQFPFDPSQLGTEGNPPPAAGYILLDRPASESAEDLTLDSLAQVIGQALVFGRQTDREARLEVAGVMADDMPKVKEMVAKLGGDAVADEPEVKTMAEVSLSGEMLQHKWRPPRDTTPEQLQALIVEHHRDALMVRWPALQLGVLDGKSPREAAADPACQNRLLAAIMVLRSLTESAAAEFDFNELRTELGLPKLDPIDPRETPIEQLPLVRLYRVTAEQASDGDVILGFRRASAFAIPSAVRSFAMAVVERETLAGKDEQLAAYRQLAQIQEDPDEALKYLEEGREASTAAGHSCASWDLAELSLRFARGEGEHIGRLVNHIQTDHLREEGVGEALMRLLVQVGAIRPDGTPAGPPPSPDGSVMVGQDQPDPQPGGIWTPGSDQGGGEKKLWTPD